MVDKRDLKIVGRVVSPIIIGPRVGLKGARQTDIVKIADRKVIHPALSVTHPQIVGQDSLFADSGLLKHPWILCF